MDVVSQAASIISSLKESWRSNPSARAQGPLRSLVGGVALQVKVPRKHSHDEICLPQMSSLSSVMKNFPIHRLPF